MEAVQIDESIAAELSANDRHERFKAQHRAKHWHPRDPEYIDFEEMEEE